MPERKVDPAWEEVESGEIVRIVDSGHRYKKESPTVAQCATPDCQYVGEVIDVTGELFHTIVREV